MFFRKKTKPATSNSSDIVLSFRLNESGGVAVGCDWPDPDSDEKVSELAQGLANLIFHVNIGKLTQSTDMALAAFGNDESSNSIVAKEARKILHVLMKNRDIALHSPLVPPRKCFDVRGIDE